MINCIDIDCVKEVAKKILEQEGIYKGDLNINFVPLPFDILSRLNGNVVEINVIKYESFSIQTSEEAEINSSYILIAILYAFLHDIEKIKQIIYKYYGENSIAYRLIDIVFQ